MAADGDLSDLADLLSHSLDSPDAVLSRVRELLPTERDPQRRSYLLQASGVARRESGDAQGGLKDLRAALRVARRHELTGRLADLNASVGSTLLRLGRARRALATFDEAMAGSAGVAAAQVEVRRGACLILLGRWTESEAALRSAVRVLDRHDETLWAARARNNLATVLRYRGRFREALRVVERATRDVESLGLVYESATMHANLASLLAVTGDVPGLLRELDVAEELLVKAGMLRPELFIDRALAYLSVNLVQDAAQQIDRARQLVSTQHVAPLDPADLFEAAARIAMADGDAPAAEAQAREGVKRLLTDGRAVDAARLRLVALEAAAATPGPPRRRVLSEAAAVSAELEAAGSWRAAEAHLLAARIALLRDDEAAAQVHLAAGTHSRTLRGRLAYHRVCALKSVRAGDRRGVLRAATNGLELLDRYRLSLGATELRATATADGADLAAMAIRQVVRDGSARQLLMWTERWRATVLDAPPVRPPHDPGLAADLARLRDLSRSEGSRANARALRERRQLEESIRRATLVRSGDASARRSRFAVPALLDNLGDTTLVSLTRVDGTCHVVVARRERVQRFVAGGTREIESLVDHLLFVLRSAGAGGQATAAALLPTLQVLAARFQDAVLGPAVEALADGPIVVIPPATLHSAPWTALPAFIDRPVAVAPSCSSWLRARRAVAPSDRRVALVAGPNLPAAAAELDHLHRLWPDAVVLRDGAATGGAVIRALEGAWLGHLAVHGTFRADNPMFSAFQLDDGWALVHEIELVQRAPYRLVLSACDSGVLRHAGADELLGAASVLLGFGTAGIMASVVPVHDAATAALSRRLHERLAAGDDLPQALLNSRRSAEDPLDQITVRAFLALGAA